MEDIIDACSSPNIEPLLALEAAELENIPLDFFNLPETFSSPDECRRLLNEESSTVRIRSSGKLGNGRKLIRFACRTPDCPMFVTLRGKDDEWKLCKCNLEHSHPLIKNRLRRSPLTDDMKKEIVLFRRAGESVSNIVTMFKERGVDVSKAQVYKIDREASMSASLSMSDTQDGLIAYEAEPLPLPLPMAEQPLVEAMEDHDYDV